MVKAFSVTLKKEKPSYGTIYSNAISSSVPYQIDDGRPIGVIANNIKEVADTYPNASQIFELDMKDVIILDSVRIKCPVK